MCGKRQSLAWDEGNLDSNEAERIARGPRMKIDEPKTPFHTASAARSPAALTDNDNDGPHSPVSVNAAAGTMPSDLTLGDRLDDISAEALSRRQREWESDDERDEGTAAAGHHRSNQSSISSGTAMSVAPPATHSHAHVHGLEYPRIEVSAAADADTEADAAGDSGAVASAPSSGAPTPEAKHAEFESKRKGNYHSMGDLLRARKLAALADEEDDE